MGLRRSWTLAMVAGEFVGFVPPAVVGAGLASIETPEVVQVLGLTVAGAGEGAVLGFAQQRVLVDHVPEVDGRRWIVVTTVAAAFAWLVGMSGPALFAADLPVVAVAVAMLPLWAAALLSMGYGQWRVLRDVVPGAGRWVWVTALAWLGGVMIPVVGLSLVPNGWPVAAHVLVGVASAVAMGAFVGASTGRVLDDLVGRRRAVVEPAEPEARPLPDARAER